MAVLDPAFWKGRSVLVTGGGGFIGAWLSKGLIDLGAKVHVLDITDRTLDALGIRQRVNFVHASILDYEKVRRAISDNGISLCFHLAAQALVTEADKRPAQTMEANITGTLNLLEAARELGSVGLVVASSDKAYGDSTVLPYTEETPICGANCYDASKAAADVITQSYSRYFGTPVAIARCGNVYGGGDLNTDRIVPGTILSIMKGQNPVIRSNGKLVRDYIYIDDVVKAYLMLGQFVLSAGCHGEAFNFGVNHPLAVLEIVNIITRTMGRTDLKPVILNRPLNEIDKQYLSSEKARRVLGWGQSVGIEEGLKLSVEWYQQHGGVQT
jgi:CDP-glucose 4,6-dehydratase